MGLFIPDDVLKRAGLSDREAIIEFACRLFDADRLDKHAAAQLAGLTRNEFEQELRARGLPIIHYTAEMWEEDRKTLDFLERRRRGAA